MSNFIQITFADLLPEQRDLLIAQLAEAGYEGFEEGEQELKAFIPQENYDKTLLGEIAYKYQLSFTEQLIPGQNWNADWESNFQPVIVDNFVAIRAGFHAPVAGVEQEIIITPKMSFGTGHHATTYMMIAQMRALDFMGKRVLDFGTGTGILAILAEKMGAGEVLALDHDDWSIANAAENIAGNRCERIRLLKADTPAFAGPFGMILANINKNVILENFPALAGLLSADGTLLLSGLLEEDETEIVEGARLHSLRLVKQQTKNRWISLCFRR